MKTGRMKKAMKRMSPVKRVRQIRRTVKTVRMMRKPVKKAKKVMKSLSRTAERIPKKTERMILTAAERKRRTAKTVRRIPKKTDFLKRNSKKNTAALPARRWREKIPTILPIRIPTLRKATGKTMIPAAAAESPATILSSLRRKVLPERMIRREKD